MKTRLISLLVAAACTVASAGAMAQGRPDDGPGARGPGGPGAQQGGPDRGGPARGQDRGPGAGPGSDRGPGPGADRGPDRGPGANRGPDRYDRGPQAHGPGPERWARGDRVPRDYRGREYVIADWRPHHLDAPPRGYQWIGVGADYFLIGIATGIVLQSVISR